MHACVSGDLCFKKGNEYAQRILHTLHISMYEASLHSLLCELHVMCAIDSVTHGEGECVWGLHSRVCMTMEKRFQLENAFSAENVCEC